MTYIKVKVDVIAGGNSPGNRPEKFKQFHALYREVPAGRDRCFVLGYRFQRF